MKISVNHGWITRKYSWNFLATERYGDPLSINTSVSRSMVIMGHPGIPVCILLWVLRGGALVNKRTPKVAVYTKHCIPMPSPHQISFFFTKMCVDPQKLWDGKPWVRLGFWFSDLLSLAFGCSGGKCVITWTVGSLEGYKEMWQQKKHGWEDMTSCVCFDMYVQVCIHI